MGDWPPVHAEPSHQEKENIYLKLVDMFVDVVEPGIVQMILQNRNWDLDASVEDIMLLASTTTQPEKSCLVKSHGGSKTKGDISQKKELYNNTTGSNFQNEGLTSNQIMTVESVIATDSSQINTNKRNISKPKFTVNKNLPNSKSSTNGTSKINVASFLEKYNHVKSIPQGYDRCLMLIQEGVKVMIILRGPPGSGKSFLARWLLTTSGIDPVAYKEHVFCTDEFFVHNDKYVYVPDQLGQAHMWNQRNAMTAIQKEVSPIIIDNTNTEVWEMRVYAEAAVSGGYDLEILEPSTWWFTKENELAKRNTHGVPKSKIRQMVGRYEKNITPQFLLQKFQLRYSLSGTPPQPVRNSKWRDKLNSQRNNKPKKKNEFSPQNNSVFLNGTIQAHPESPDLKRSPSIKSTLLFQNEKVKNYSSTVPEHFVNGVQVSVLAGVTKQENVELGLDFTEEIESKNIVEDLINFQNIQTYPLSQKENCEFETSSSKDSLNMSSASNSRFCSDKEQKEAGSTHCKRGTRLSTFDLMAETNKLLAALGKTTNASNETQNSLEPSFGLFGNKPYFKAVEWDRIPENNQMVLPQEENKNCLTNDTSSDISDLSDSYDEKISATKDLLDSLLMKVIQDTENGKTGNECEASSKKQEYTAEIILNEKRVEFDPLIASHTLTETKPYPESSQYQLRDVDIQERSTIFLNEFENGLTQKNEGTREETKPPSLEYKWNGNDGNSPSDTTHIQNQQETNKIGEQAKSVLLPLSNHIEDPKENSVSSETDGGFSEQNLCSRNDLSSTYNNVIVSTGTSFEGALSCNESNTNCQCKSDVSLLKAKDISNTLCNNSLPEYGNDNLQNSAKGGENLEMDLFKKQAEVSNWEDENAKCDSERNKITPLEISEPKPARNLSRPRYLTSNVSSINSQKNESGLNLESWDIVSNAKENWETIDSFIEASTSINEIILPQRPRLSKKQMVESSSNTSYLDVLHNDIEHSKGIKILTCNPRSITTDNCQAKPLVTETLYLDKSTMTQENYEQSFDINQITSLFPKIPEKYIIHMVEKCQGNIDWAVDLLLDSEDNFYPFEQESINNSRSNDNNKTDESLVIESEANTCVQGKLSPKREFRISNTEEQVEIKKTIESCIVFGKEHYSQKILKVLKKKHPEYANLIENGQAQLEQATTSVSPLSTNNGPNEVLQISNFCVNEHDDDDDSDDKGSSGSDCSSSGSEKEDTTMELIFDSDLILQLQQRFGNSNFTTLMSSSPVVKLPVSLARQLYGYVMDSMQTNIDQQQDSIERMIVQDEEVAKIIQDEEENSANISQLQNIMDMEMALTVHRADQEEWNRKRCESVAAKLSRKILLEKFPRVDPKMLTDLLHINNFSLHNTEASLRLALGVDEDEEKVVEEVARHSQQNHIREARTTFLVVSEPGKEEADSSSVFSEAQFHREEATTYYLKRMECLNKAREAFCSGSKEVATYYSQMAEVHKTKMEKCNLQAATYLMDSHKSGTNTLDLHFLHVTEAEVVLDLFLDKSISQLGVQDKQRKYVFLITGRGLRSKGGISRIKPMVKRKLKARGIVYKEINPGMLSATISCSTPLSHNC